MKRWAPPLGAHAAKYPSAASAAAQRTCVASITCQWLLRTERAASLSALGAGPAAPIAIAHAVAVAAHDRSAAAAAVTNQRLLADEKSVGLSAT
jgi:hypothetical protein